MVVVSVFSDESRVVQHDQKTAGPAGISEFQYSLTNLVWCNRKNPNGVGMKLRVSVFSDESRVVQPITETLVGYDESSFSIL